MNLNEKCPRTVGAEPKGKNSLTNQSTTDVNANVSLGDTPNKAKYKEMAI